MQHVATAIQVSVAKNLQVTQKVLITTNCTQIFSLQHETQ